MTLVRRLFWPNRAIDKIMFLGVAGGWVALAFVVWLASPWASLPGPGEVFGALRSLWWEHGMGPELFTTLGLIGHALFLTVVISLLLSYATVINFFRPLVAAVSKLRFLGLTGLVAPFTLMTGGGLRPQDRAADVRHDDVFRHRHGTGRRRDPAGAIRPFARHGRE
jgi:hypothetical protein